jgi:glycosyltransferase involved in cell wall biosynthesis
MKVLISAYSCAPHRGSEPGIGWNTAIQLSQDHEVWVITHTREREAIEKELAARPRPQLHVCYYEMPLLLRAVSFYQVDYYLWQYGVYPLARRLHKEVDFDVIHHATFGRYWSPSLFVLLDAPFVWGPVGGGETVPRAFRGCLGIQGRIVERFKDFAFALSRHDPLLRKTVSRADVILANTQRTAQELDSIVSRPVDFMDAAVIDRDVIRIIDGIAERELDEQPPKVCFASLTRLLPWKGVHLGLHAFKRLNNPDARYWIVGDGPARTALESLAKKLGIAEQVVFFGDPPRSEWMRLLKQSNALIHTTLANTFNMIVVEAMVCAKPTIGLSLGGMQNRLDDDVGYPVPAPDPERAIEGLAVAMKAVMDDPHEAATRGARARERALRNYTWEPRIERLNQYFDELVAPAGFRA